MHTDTKRAPYSAIPALLAVTLVIAGCTGTKRECPAFFNPNYSLWGQQTVGKTLVFTDQGGKSEIFKVAQIERNEPFQTIGRGVRVDDVVCKLSVQELLTRQDSRERILQVFTHGEFTGRDINEESFNLAVFVDIGETSKYRDFTMNLHRRDNLDDGFLRYSFYPELEIGKTLYENVIKEEIIEDSLLEDPEQIQSIVLASGYGIVQYTRVNGSVFSRVLP